jgi:hypothetical protein
MTTRRTIACLLSNEIRTNSNQPATEGGIRRGQTTACTNWSEGERGEGGKKGVTNVLRKLVALATAMR